MTSPGTHGPGGPADAPAPRRVARAGAVTCLALVLLAVTWPSGSQIADLKDGLGPWFLSAHDKDVVLNLVMLAPPVFLATVGWQRVPWWAWALAGCALGCCAELTQLLAPLGRRPSLDNALQNAAGAWAGAVLALVVLHLPRVPRRSGSGG